MALELGAHIIPQIVLIIAFGVIAARIGRHLRIPQVLPLLITGYLIGPDMLNLLHPSQFGVTLEFLAFATVPVILFYEALKTDFDNLRQRARAVFSIVTLAVAVTVIGIAVFAKFFLNLSWEYSFLLGAILSSTDPAAILPVLRKLNVSRKVATVLEAETALNDASAITIFVIVLAAASGSTVTLQDGVAKFFTVVFWSAGVGTFVGLLAYETFRRLRAEQDLMLASIAVLLSTYVSAEALGGSGPIAAVFAALLFSKFLRSRFVNAVDRLYVFGAWDDLSFFAVAIIFLSLGANLSVSTLLPFLPVGIFIGVAFMLVVRPVTVFVSLFFDKDYSFNEKLLISWLGSPRGTVSAALASVVVARAAQGIFPATEALAIFSITLVVIAVTIIISSATADRAVHYLLGISEEKEGRYLRLSTDLKASMVALSKLQQDHKSGLVSKRIYSQLENQLATSIDAIEKELSDLTKQEPRLEKEELAGKVRELIAVQIDKIDELYSKGEITHETYETLLEKYNSALGRLEEY